MKIQEYEMKREAPEIWLGEEEKEEPEEDKEEEPPTPNYEPAEAPDQKEGEPEEEAN